MTSRGPIDTRPNAGEAALESHPPRERLIYVLSNGRSGSTLLDSLLGAHPECFSAGELQVLPHEVRENRAPCGCGEPLENCPFWGPMLAELPLEAGPGGLAHFREHHNAGRLLRAGHLKTLLTGRLPAEHVAAARDYGELNARVIARVRQRAVELGQSPPRWIVDASKDLYRLAWLALSGRFDLRVIHLIKDPRSFVHSMAKGGRATPRNYLRFTGRWVIENRLMARFCELALAPEQVRRLNYEELAGSPESTLQRLGQWLGLGDLAAHGKSFRARPAHGIAGGRMRFASGPVRLDEAWRAELGTVPAALVSLATRGARVRLGRP